MVNFKNINIIYLRNKHPLINENSPDKFISGLLIILLKEFYFNNLSNSTSNAIPLKSLAAILPFLSIR